MLLAVLSLLASGVVPSAYADAKASIGVVSGAFTAVGLDLSSAPVAVAWTMPVDGDSEFTDRLFGETHPENSIQSGSQLIAEGTAPPAETRSEARVPEPSTLALLGSGMIAMARVARFKWRFRVKAARISQALPGEA
jgi:hypothetical protein